MCATHSSQYLRYRCSYARHVDDGGVGDMVTIDDFQKLDVRVGRIVSCDLFPEARKPAYKLTIDCGEEIGVKHSSAQITENYRPEALLGKLVLCVVNFPPRQIGSFLSEVLTLGVPDEQGNVVLIRPDGDTPLGAKLY